MSWMFDKLVIACLIFSGSKKNLFGNNITVINSLNWVQVPCSELKWMIW